MQCKGVEPPEFAPPYVRVLARRSLEGLWPGA
jgi:hypothetical protein